MTKESGPVFTQCYDHDRRASVIRLVGDGQFYGVTIEYDLGWNCDVLQVHKASFSQEKCAQWADEFNREHGVHSIVPDPFHPRPEQVACELDYAPGSDVAALVEVMDTKFADFHRMLQAMKEGFATSSPEYSAALAESLDTKFKANSTGISTVALADLLKAHRELVRAAKVCLSESRVCEGGLTRREQDLALAVAESEKILGKEPEE